MDASETAQDQYASFLVRLWRSGDAAPEGCNAGWQGEIVHIQGGCRWPLAGTEALLPYLRQLIEPECTALLQPARDQSAGEHMR